MSPMKALPVAILVIVAGTVMAFSAYDSDGDGVPDYVDVCCGTPIGTSVDDSGRPIGDVDGDCDVDLTDAAMLHSNFTGPLYPCNTCNTSNDCAGDEYCARRHTDCQREGTCSPSPVSCADDWAPICACDGQTYDNSCYAAVAGVSVNYEGECQDGCDSNVVCDTGFFCSKDIGDCGGVGECRQLPGGCIPGGGPSVCGCDGVTYNDGCYARLAGVSVAHEGACP